jgi:type VII secretion protein EccB
MHNRRDQVHAHGFMVGRLVSALLRGEPDMAIPPLRRSWSGLIIGSLVAVLVVAGFSMLAVVSPGGSSAWRKSGTLILDKQTGARYVYAGGRLRPVLNYASARLLLGAKLKVVSVTSKSLKSVPMGGTVGIVGAPDALPAAKGQKVPWLACATTTGSQPALALYIGPAADVRPISAGQAVLVRSSDGTTYLITGGRRLRVTAPWAMRALGFSDNSAVGVRDAWLDTLPAGPDLPQPVTPGIGGAAPALDGHPAKAGQVFVSREAGGDQRYYLLTTEGLQSITQTAATLILADPQTAKAYPGTVTAIELGPAALAASKVVSAPSWTSALPAALPTPDAVGSGRMPCVTWTPGGETSLVTMPARPATAVTTVLSGTSSGARTTGAPVGNRIADQVLVAPGAGLLARTLPAPGTPGEGLYLVTEDGVRFPVASVAAATALGYSTAAMVAVPSDLLALLPTGPVLQTLGSGGG